MRETYTKAATELLLSGVAVEEVLKNTRAVMERRGHSSLYLGVLQDLMVALETAEKSNRAKLTLASEGDVASAAAALKELSVDTDNVETKIDPTIIGGAVVQYKNMSIDSSFKTTLAKLYKNITTTK